MQGNSHVRFGERRVETGRREAVRRYAPTLPALRSAGSSRDHATDRAGRRPGPGPAAVETGLHGAQRRKTGGSAGAASRGEVALGSDGPRARFALDRL